MTAHRGESGTDLVGDVADLEQQIRAIAAERDEAFERQTATAEILKVIASSPSDVQPVFEAIAERANRLIRGLSTAVYNLVNDTMHLMAFTRTSPEADATLQASFPRPLSEAPWADQIRKGEIVEIPDAEIEWADHPALLKMVRLRGFRGQLLVPLLRAGTTVGLISVTRAEPGTFAPHHVQLLQTFADQAVIAIQNARMFNETREALERQTATADILKVIASSPSDVQPVFEAIAERSKRLVDALSTTVFRLEGGMMHLKAFTTTGSEADASLKAMFPAPLSNFSWSAPIGNGEIYRVVDTELEIESLRDLARLRGFRSMLFVPLLSDGKPIGLIAVTRAEPGPFVEHHVQLLQTFADQAVIAIENVRLFDEVQARTEDLRESLQQQTATADVLKVISRSAFDLQAVLDTLVASAASLCSANRGIIFLRDGEWYRAEATFGTSPEAEEFLVKNPRKAGRESVAPRVILSGQVEQIPDIQLDKEFNFPVAQLIPDQRSFIGVPLLRDATVEGVFVLSRPVAGLFSAREVDLLTTFADQAVIAIENTRLFNETKEALERQTATAEILKVIASSPDDVQPVFQAIAERSNHLGGGFAATVVSIIDDVVHLSAFTPTTPAADAAIMAFYPRPLSGFSYSDAVRRGEIHRIVDIELEPGIESDQLTMVRQRGWRSALWVPLLLEGEAIGVIGVTRVEPGAFADHHVEMLKTFADQAVIAISNVKLFKQVQERTRELSVSLENLRTAQDRLVQTEKLASLGQLTAGIAHEIKNPLNFVNNFAALSAELTDELNDVLRPAALANKMRQEIDELTGMLKDNLKKVVQHGKRADSIVKNMLLHSREGSGDNRPADINALLDESLNLAYHGARAEKPGFNVTLQRDFDESAGLVELFPQEITRAFLNLISNGFYATAKRKSEVAAHSGFEPMLQAATRNIGNSVEIRIRDNGTGIPAEVKEKMFNPFFTTKPAGEGTGLGLSMSHDIIVKQHGGTIDVATELGQYTEFKIVLPRTSDVQNKKSSQT